MSANSPRVTFHDVLAANRDFGEALGRHSDSLAKHVIAERTEKQDAAFFEFLYALIFLTVREVGARLKRRGFSLTQVRAAMEPILTELVSSAMVERFPQIDVTEPATAELLLDHRRAMESRLTEWTRLPLTIDDKRQGMGGTFVWEIPRQACISAGLEESVRSLPIITASMELMNVYVTFVLQAADAFVALMDAAVRSERSSP